MITATARETAKVNSESKNALTNLQWQVARSTLTNPVRERQVRKKIRNETSSQWNSQRYETANRKYKS